MPPIYNIETIISPKKNLFKYFIKLFIDLFCRAVYNKMNGLLSIVQMPSGIPVATVGVNGGENAGLLALQILGIKYPEIEEKLAEYKRQMQAKINADDEALQALL